MEDQERTEETGEDVEAHRKPFNANEEPSEAEGDDDVEAHRSNQRNVS